MGGFDLRELSGFIAGSGFAVFVAVWMLVRVTGRIEELTVAIRELKVFLEDNCSRGGLHGKSS